MSINIALIAAREGSKELPGKNVMDFAGKPLIARSIEQALAASTIDSVWVTSDSQEILNIAQLYGANPILRPVELATDKSTSDAAWLHALEFIETQYNDIDAVVTMQLTSPLRESTDIDKAIEIFFAETYDSLFSATKLDDFLFWERNQQSEYVSVNYNYRERGRRQDRKPQFLENGSFYIFKPSILKELKNRLGGKIGVSLMEFWKSFEIDKQEDFVLCETIYENFILNKENKEIGV